MPKVVLQLLLQRLLGQEQLGVLDFGRVLAYVPEEARCLPVPVLANGVPSELQLHVSVSEALSPELLHQEVLVDLLPSLPPLGDDFSERLVLLVFAFFSLFRLHVLSNLETGDVVDEVDDELGKQLGPPGNLGAELGKSEALHLVFVELHLAVDVLAEDGVEGVLLLFFLVVLRVVGEETPLVAPVGGTSRARTR